MKLDLLAIIVLGVALLWLLVDGFQNRWIRCLVRGGLTLLTMSLLNIITPIGMVAINSITILIGAILGIPGIMCMYVLRMLYP